MTLENIINNEPKKSWKAAIADTLTAVSFSIAAGTCFDLYAGINLHQWAQTRTIMGTISAVAGRSYGKYRNLVNRTLGVTKESGLVRRGIADSLASMTFWAPIYAAALYLSGADHEKIAKGCAMQTAVSFVIGRPYGWYQDKMRKLFGVPSEYQK